MSENLNIGDQVLVFANHGTDNEENYIKGTVMELFRKEYSSCHGSPWSKHTIR